MCVNHQIFNTDLEEREREEVVLLVDVPKLPNLLVQTESGVKSGGADSFLEQVTGLKPHRSL